MNATAAGSVSERARPAMGRSQRIWTMTALTVAVAFSFLDRQLMALLVGPIKRDLHLSDTQVSLLIGFTFVLFYVGLGVPLSRLVDRGSRKWIIGLGLIFWSLMTAACGLARSFWQLALARTGLGIGESCNTPATYSMVSDMYPRERLARAIAIVNLGNVAGQGLAFLIGGTLVLWLGHGGAAGWPLVGDWKPWQLTFLLLGIPGLIWGLVMIATVPEAPRAAEAERGAPVPAVATVVRFVLRWRKAYLPLILAITIKAMLSFGTTAWAPSLLEREFGWKTGEPGLYIGVVSLVSMPLGLIVGGWLSDWRTASGKDDANAFVMALSTTALVPCAILFPLMPNAGLMLAMLGGSLFFGAVGTSPGNAAIQLITPGRMRGTVTAFYLAVMNVLGYGAGPLLVATFTDRLFGSEAMLAQSMALTAALLAPIGALLSWYAIRTYVAAVAEAKAEAGPGA